LGFKNLQNRIYRYITPIGRISNFLKTTIEGGEGETNQYLHSLYWRLAPNPPSRQYKKFLRTGSVKMHKIPQEMEKWLIWDYLIAICPSRSQDLCLFSSSAILET